jgi:hypothetical protein
MTPNGNVDRNGGGAVASMGGPGRCCVNAASVTSERETAAVTGISNFDVFTDVDFDFVSPEPPFIINNLLNDEC